MAGEAGTRGRPPFQAFTPALGALAAAVALGFSVQSCAVSASSDCAEKASCTADGADDGSTTMANPEAGALEAGGQEAGGDASGRDGAILDVSPPEVADVVTAVAADGSVVGAAGDGAVGDGVATNLGDGEGGGVVGVAEGGTDATDAGTVGSGGGAVDAGGGNVDASDAAIADAAGDGPAPLCASGQCPPACAAASEILQLAASRHSSDGFGTADTVCVLFHGSVHGWGVSNGDGRMVTAMGATTFGPASATTLGTPPAIRPGADGFLYWIFTAGTLTYTSMSIF